MNARWSGGPRLPQNHPLSDPPFNGPSSLHWGRSACHAVRGQHPFNASGAEVWKICCLVTVNRKFNLFETGVETLFPGEHLQMAEKRLDGISPLTPSGILDDLTAEKLEKLKDCRWLYTAQDCATKSHSGENA